MRWMKSSARSRYSAGILIFAGGACLLTSCAAPVQWPVDRGPEGDPIAAARELQDAPEIVRDGNAGTSCGEFVLGQGDAIPAEAIACLTAATQKEEAELAWSQPTVEGDPIVYFAYVASWNEGVVLSMTNEFDRYGGEFGWTQQSCPDATTATSIVSSDGCRDFIEG